MDGLLLPIQQALAAKDAEIAARELELANKNAEIMALRDTIANRNATITSLRKTRALMIFSRNANKVARRINTRVIELNHDLTIAMNQAIADNNNRGLAQISKAHIVATVLLQFRSFNRNPPDVAEQIKELFVKRACYDYALSAHHRLSILAAW